MVAWPASLPQSPLLRGFVETAPDGLLRTAMDTGPAKTRRRFTAAVRPVKYPLLLTTAQTETLDDFFVNTLASGALSFTHIHPRTTLAATYRIIGKPQYIPVSGSKWTTILDLEILPT